MERRRRIGLPRAQRLKYVRQTPMNGHTAPWIATTGEVAQDLKLPRGPVGLWSACRVVRKQGWRPTETELGDVAEHVVTFRHGSAFHPCH